MVHQDENLPTLTAQLVDNQAKNRSSDCVPYDSNLVTVEDEYFNASICSGFGDKKYILTQGKIFRQCYFAINLK